MHPDDFVGFEDIVASPSLERVGDGEEKTDGEIACFLLFLRI